MIFLVCRPLACPSVSHTVSESVELQTTITVFSYCNSYEGDLFGVTCLPRIQPFQ